MLNTAEVYTLNGPIVWSVQLNKAVFKKSQLVNEV